MKVGVTGAGVMGSDIAYLFFNANHKVEPVDKSEEALKKAKEKHNIAKAQLKEAGLLDSINLLSLIFTLGF